MPISVYIFNLKPVHCTVGTEYSLPFSSKSEAVFCLQDKVRPSDSKKKHNFLFKNMYCTGTV
jgi:hypothetical protein